MTFAASFKQIKDVDLNPERDKDFKSVALLAHYLKPLFVNVTVAVSKLLETKERSSRFKMLSFR